MNVRHHDRVFAVLLVAFGADLCADDDEPPEERVWAILTQRERAPR